MLSVIFKCQLFFFLSETLNVFQLLGVSDIHDSIVAESVHNMTLLNCNSNAVTILLINRDNKVFP